MTGFARHQGGLAAEEAAARFYLAEGGRVLARRWRCPEGEIDLVIGFPGLVVFVEVKARRTRDAAAASVSSAQWTRLAAAAARFLEDQPPPAPDCRFDLVLFDRKGTPERIENAATFDEW